MFFKINRGEITDCTPFTSGKGGSCTVTETFDYEGEEFTTTHFLKTFDSTIFSTIAWAVENDGSGLLYLLEGKVQYSRTTSEKACTENGEAFEYHSTGFAITSIKRAKKLLDFKKKSAVKNQSIKNKVEKSDEIEEIFVDSKPKFVPIFN